MKPLFNNLNDVLTYNLEGLYDAEKMLQKALPEITDHVNSSALLDEYKKYMVSASDKRIKLKRAFGYLLAGPFGRRNMPVREMISELTAISKNGSSTEIKDVLLAECLLSIIQYKISACASAVLLASVIESYSVADLLTEMVVWEKAAEQALSKIVSKLNCTADSSVIAHLQ